MIPVKTPFFKELGLSKRSCMLGAGSPGTELRGCWAGDYVAPRLSKVARSFFRSRI